MILFLNIPAVISSAKELEILTAKQYSWISFTE